MTGERVGGCDTPAGSAGPLVPLVPGKIADHVACTVLKIGQVVFRLMENELSPLGLRIRHYSILEALADGGPLSQQDLGTHLRIDGATMVTSIDDLERSGLVARERAATDRRMNLISITPEGRSMLARVNALMDELDGCYFADITLSQRERLHKTMRKLSEGPTLTRAFDDSRRSMNRAPLRGAMA